jgi:hypothetical protein
MAEGVPACYLASMTASDPKRTFAPEAGAAEPLDLTSSNTAALRPGSTTLRCRGVSGVGTASEEGLPGHLRRWAGEARIRPSWRWWPRPARARTPALFDDKRQVVASVVRDPLSLLQSAMTWSPAEARQKLFRVGDFSRDRRHLQCPTSRNRVAARDKGKRDTIGPCPCLWT